MERLAETDLIAGGVGGGGGGPCDQGECRLRLSILQFEQAATEQRHSVRRIRG